MPYFISCDFFFFGAVFAIEKERAFARETHSNSVLLEPRIRRAWSKRYR